LPSSQNRLLFTLATYNEIENVPRLVAELRSICPDAHILVVDDNSPDGTGKWVERQQASDPKIHLLSRSGKQGLGTATIAAMRYAIEWEYDVMLNLDADFSHNPTYVPQMLDALDQSPPADIVIGSRYVPGGGIKHWPLSRLIGSQLVNLATRWLLWLAPKDCSGAYRAWRVDLLRRIPLNAIASRGYAFQEESLWYARRAGARMREVPIVFGDREQGKSKINAKETVAVLGTLFRLGLRTWLLWQ
jgi:dolichol-phosphate mannosyltransferase